MDKKQNYAFCDNIPSRGMKRKTNTDAEISSNISHCWKQFTKHLLLYSSEQNFQGLCTATVKSHWVGESVLACLLSFNKLKKIIKSKN